jgi:NAD(P)-dependent dehydrogenase (short-subunit alcohol dehydrogenase family)
VAGQTFLVTGGNTGIGRATAAALAQRGGRVVVACRSRDKGEAAVAAIKAATGNDAVRFLPLDLADLDSVRSCAASFLALGEPLHVLVNNAGVGGGRGVTRQGFELAFGVNHLGHFVLTSALLGCLTASAPSRVVTVSSDSHYSAKGIDFGALRRGTRSLTGLREYAVSKLCNVLFTQELARRTAGTGLTTYALHPGVVASDIWRRVPWPVRPLVTRRMLSVEQGAATSLYCATSPEVAASSGKFYDKCAERPPSKVATPSLAAELWQRSEAWAALLLGRRPRHPCCAGAGWRGRWLARALIGAGVDWRGFCFGVRDSARSLTNPNCFPSPRQHLSSHVEPYPGGYSWRAAPFS